MNTDEWDGVWGRGATPPLSSCSPSVFIRVHLWLIPEYAAAMLLGILSDSHGRADTTRLAVKLLRDRGAELLLHLGDIGGEQVIDELVGQPARIVFGNCDWNDRELGRYAEILGIINDHPIGRLTIDDKDVAFTTAT
jgi:hypothetical protein